MPFHLYKRRIVIAVCSIFVICIMLIVRLYTLAMGQNPALEVLSGQYTRKNTVLRRDGFVYDTRGELLSHKHDGAVVIVKPVAKADRNRVVGYLSDFSGYGFEELLEKYNKMIPFTLKLESIPEKTPPEGVYIYPSYALSENSFCRHILGFRNSDGKGVSGILSCYGDTLEGYSGSISYKYTANARGGVLEGGSFYIEDRNYSTKGGIVLTLDGKLQSEVDGICDRYMDMGAVVISEISTGNILALSSRPLYNRDDVASSLASERGELINRAFSLYTPGSVFKAVVAAAALEKDERLYEFEYECTGECDVSGKIFRCHEKNGHGVQTMKAAFANSCNTYFINLLQETGFEYVLTLCNRMGLGNPYSVDGLYVDGANMPDYGKAYPDAYKANFAFGQGELLMSCMDVLNIYSVCASGYGRDFSLVKGISDMEAVSFKGKDARRILSEGTVLKMRELMKECVTSGTGKEASVKGISVGGKTATAQSGQIKNGTEVLHKWFAGVFPIDEPRYAIAVLCDGNGENNASPKKIFGLCAECVAEIYDN